MAYRIKDPVLSLLWNGFSPWPGNFHMLHVQPKKKKEEEKDRQLHHPRTVF